MLRGRREMRENLELLFIREICGVWKGEDESAARPLE
jgi:hypothetical protein